MRCFFSFSSTSVAAPTLSTATPPESLARRSWSFSRSKSLVVSSICSLICDLRASMALESPALDDRGGVLGGGHATRLAKVLDLDAVQLAAELLADHPRTGQGGDVLQHGLTAIAEARSLDGQHVQRATQLVDHQGRQRLAIDVLGDDQERLALRDDLLEGRQDIGHGADLLVGHQDEGLVEHRLHAAVVGGGHVGRKVAAVELHALDVLDVELQALALLDGHHAVLADLLHDLGDQLADVRVARADGGDVGDVVLAVHRLAEALDAPRPPRPRRARCRASGPSGWRRR